MGRKPCCDKEGVNRGAWSVMEDQILTNYINAHGEGKWRDLPLRAGLNRCGKSCRLRWLNYLRPDIKRGNISEDEEQLIIRLHNLLGNRWSLIAGRLPGRTDNEIKNFWNTNLSKRVEQNNSHNKPQNPSISRAHHQPAMKRTKTSSLDASCADAALSSHQSHPVIQTKAVRCTKLQVGLPLMHEPNAAAQRESQSGSASMSTTIQDKNEHLCSYGVLQDFDIDELLIPEDVPEGPCTSYLQHHENDDVLNEQYYSGDLQMHGDANNIDVSVGGDETNPQSWMVEGFFQLDYYEDVDLSSLNLELD